MYYDGEINGTPYVYHEGINYCITKSKNSSPDSSQYPFQVEISLSSDQLPDISNALVNSKGEYCIGMTSSGFDNETDMRTFVLTVNRQSCKLRGLGKFMRVY